MSIENSVGVILAREEKSLLVGSSSPAFTSRGGSWLNSDRAILISIQAVTSLVYLRSLFNGLTFDDEGMIVRNGYIRHWSYIWQVMVHDLWWFMDPSRLPQSAHYRPLVALWFGLNYLLFGLHTSAWHAATVALHLTAVWLVFKIAARLTGDSRSGLLAALMFALLPAHDQAVAWISSISLLLGGTLELAAFYLLITRDSEAQVSWRRMGGSLALYAAATLCHESAVAFPALVAAYVFMLEPGGENLQSGFASLRHRIERAALWSSPFVGVAIVYMIARRLVLGFFLNGPFHFMNRTLMQSLMTIPRVLLTYLAVLVAPWMTGTAHRQLIVTTPGSPDFVQSAAAPDFYVPVFLLATLAGLFLWSVMKSPRRRLYVFCAIWMGIAISPMMDFTAIMKGLLVQNAYLYLISFGWCVIAVDSVLRFARRRSLTQRSLVGLGAIAFLIVCAFELWRVQPIWHDDVTLFTRGVEDFPDSYSSHLLLGEALTRSHDLVRARRELVQAIALDPGDDQAFEELSKTDTLSGDIADASKELARALSLKPRPTAKDYTLLAQLYDAVGEGAESEAALKYAQSLPQGPVEVGIARAQIAMRRSDSAAAENILRNLAANYPGNYRVWALLGEVLRSQNHDNEALTAFDRALAIAPPDPMPHFFAARLLHKMGRDRDALTQCRLALAIWPGDTNARTLMAQIQSQTR